MKQVVRITKIWWRDLDPHIFYWRYCSNNEERNLFEKGYTQRWTEKIFKISKSQLTIPVTFKITDYNGEEIQGSFYEQEL